jgi:hypothetical protein
MTACSRKRPLLLMAAGLMIVVAGVAIALLAHRVSSDTPSGKSHFPWIVLLPVYTSLIPIYVGVARRRREKNKTNG